MHRELRPIARAEFLLVGAASKRGFGMTLVYRQLVALSPIEIISSMRL